MNPLLSPERIAFAGDWHMNGSWGVSAIHYAAERQANVILHAGDFGYSFHFSFLNRLEDALAETNIPLLFVDGNHENHKWLLKQKLDPAGLRPITPHIWHIPRGFRWEWEGVRFLGLGGAHSVDGPWRRQNGYLWQKEELITPEQASLVKADGKADVMLTHDCPHGVDIPGIDTDGSVFPWLEIQRSEEHRKLLRTVVDVVQPRLIWHGHYHRNYYREVDFGYGTVDVQGLDMDGTSFKNNVSVIDMGIITANIALLER